MIVKESFVCKVTGDRYVKGSEYTGGRARELRDAGFVEGQPLSETPKPKGRPPKRKHERVREQTSKEKDEE